jgi:tetratricopeptide (TPR) repeat protein
MNARARHWFLLIVCASLFLTGCSKKESGDEFTLLMNRGKTYLDQAQAGKAEEVYSKAAQLHPNDPEVRLNLANAYLLAGDANKALSEANQSLAIDNNLAAAWFVKGCALLRMGQNEDAVKALQTVQQLDPAGDPALFYQLGMAHLNLKQYEEAIAAFSEVTALVANHPSAHYQLSQALRRAGQVVEADAELQIHQQIAAQNAGKSISAADLERSRYTQARVPFRLAQPALQGIPVRFTDKTDSKLGPLASRFSGPVAVLDPNHATNFIGMNSLFAMEQGRGFRLLWNSNLTFHAGTEVYPAITGASYSKLLVGDLNNDRFEDVIALSDKGANVFRFAPNGVVTDVTPFSRIDSLAAKDGTLVDLDFTGKLDLVAVTSGTNSLRIFRQFGPFLFSDVTSTSGIPAQVTSAVQVVADDWPKDEMMDLIAGRGNENPMLLVKVRGGTLHETNNLTIRGGVIASGDMDNDLRVDLVAVNGSSIQIAFQGSTRTVEFKGTDANVKRVYLQDFDNDGWLDIWTVGDRIQVWRNLGEKGFQNVTASLHLDALQGGPFNAITFADFDNDGDSDFILEPRAGGLRYLENEGGNANRQVKIQLLGNRSNSSGLGVKIEITAGNLRLVRTVQSLPIEIGVGANTNLDALTVHWFNLAVPSVDVAFDPRVPLVELELTLPEGSCPYLYAWDGTKFRFVTDILGAAPAGLPVAEGKYIEADSDEYVWLGDEKYFQPLTVFYTVQITEELREALYLDQVKLAVIDHRAGAEVHPLDKLVPGRPFPPSAFLAVEREHPLREAIDANGKNVTDLIQQIDGRRFGPTQLREPQKRGLAEPYSVTLDFGPLETTKRLVLVANGWLRFGGGMANINGSQDSSLPFPFPTLEAEVNGEWKSVDVVMGAPAGKTKTTVTDLTRKLPEGTRRLRLSAAFEIYWDRIALLEKADHDFTVREYSPTKADLHWRGFSRFESLSSDWPLTPIYKDVAPNPYWRITPAGWCTRYGTVLELVQSRDEALLIMNGGDELTLQFAASELPSLKEGHVREYFLYSDGWDKDSDFHVAAGTTVEPIPWHGMDDQKYGEQKRPAFPADGLMQRYNTRWVGERVLARQRSN